MAKANDRKAVQEAPVPESSVKGRTLNDVLAAMPQDRRERIEARVTEKLREVEGLKALRKLTHRSQEQIAQSLGVKQPSALKTERQAELYLSTLRRFVEAGGGKLELRVELPGPGPGALVPTGIGTDDGEVEAQHVA